ncbi:acyltransferase [Sulfurospirillum oryzae]|uniref:acyltransferase n=1 Tax=Sulfurospirillum oryzae TaxID=2976535 RepID=UPI0021E902DC|nr:acyltransferase [Sulfurospirillum oryzae]
MLRNFFLLLFEKRDEIKKKFKRVLPIGDYISDRWEKAQYCGFGEFTSIYDSSLVLGNVKVGKNCWIGPFTILDGSGGSLLIGDNCNISAGTHIYTHDTVDKVLYGHEVKKLDTTIGNNVYIGPNVVVIKGITIGDNVIIGANSFVNKDIPSYSKAFGTPIKIISSIKK